ncbi:MAG: 3-hydroxyacyl-CoA dehydrogenase NAD-binding domain-containing protein, partial [Thermoplasmata archaeon]|nr:3-hydroxyacyl-CoA dehydrogenase NAD-binding domain-containing protein [Thermoplasmata archaeon]
MRVQKVGVVGAGTMGAAIAELFAFNGYPVVLKDLTPELVERGTAKVQSLVQELVDFQLQRPEKEIQRIQALGLSLTTDQ